MQADANSIILKCEIQMHIKSTNAQGEAIQDDWIAYINEIELTKNQYFMTSLDGVSSWQEQGSVTSSSQRFFLKSNVNNETSLMSKISSQMYIDRITGEFYADSLYSNNETGGTSAFSSHGPCELQDTPITKF